jgi:hypothetical protein
MDVLHQAKGVSSWSSTLRSDGSQDYQAGEVGTSRAVTQQRPRVSKLGLKVLSTYHSNEIAVEAARQGASRPNKKGYSHETSTLKRSAGQQL